jgi:hypothetical protein
MKNRNATNIADPFIFRFKTAFMQRIADLVRSGHTQYVMGTIPISKAGFFAHKIEAQYHTDYSKLEACRARQRGEASARLLFLHQDGKELLIWFLLFHPGTTQDESGQNWRDAMVDRIVLTGYELVRRTRPGSNKPAWTWRYTLKQYDSLRDSIIAAIRNKHDLQLKQSIHSISRSPGFAGVREQVKKLYSILMSEWKRRRAKSEILPELPRHGYTRRIESRGCRLTELDVRNAKFGQRAKDNNDKDA